MSYQIVNIRFVCKPHGVLNVSIFVLEVDEEHIVEINVSHLL